MHSIMFSKEILFFSFFFFFIEASSSSTLEVGQKIFLTNCNVCHIGGDNIIIPEKNLKKIALKGNGMNTLDAIIYQVTNGKNGMPAFGGRLKEKDIQDVASYVLKQFVLCF